MVAAIVATILLLGPQSAHARAGPADLSHFRSLLGGDAPEWGASFVLTGDSQTWHMQQKGCEWADPSMKLVFFKTDSTTTGTINPLLTAATSLMFPTTETDCPIVEAGETISNITTDGNCYNLKVDKSGTHSKWTITTTDVTKIVVYAQHDPKEFEENQHYLTKGPATGTVGDDIEPAGLASGTAGHSHAKDTCACKAIDHGFTIDCSNMAAISEAFNYLEENKATCQVAEACPANTDLCKRNYLYLMAHHDHCAHTEVPEAAEKGIHSYEKYYAGCSIHRRYNTQIEDCPALPVPCKQVKQTTTTAIANIKAKGCLTTCTGPDADPECKALYQKILLAHDTCAHDELDTELEVTLHDMEDACEDALCNTAKGPVDVACNGLSVLSGAAGTLSSMTYTVLAAISAAMMLAAA